MEQGPNFIGNFPILLGSYFKDMEDCMVLVGALVSSVSTTMFQLYCDQEFVLFSLLNVEHFHPQETVLLHVMCGKDNRHSEKVSSSSLSVKRTEHSKLI